MTFAISSLFTAETAEQIFNRGLAVARVIGLAVTSWRTGDPTRSTYKFLAEVLAAKEEQNVEYIKAGFLSSAEGDWLPIHGDEVYGVEIEEATYATPTATLTNSGGGYYDVNKVGRLRVKASSTEKTYHNTSLGVLSAGATVTFDLIADEAGSDSTVGVDEIDEIVTTMLGVEIDSSTAATAQDEQDPEAYREQCLATLGALSPDGPPDAYEYVARNAELTGVDDVTRAKSIADSDINEITVYLAGGAGPVAGASVTAVQDALEVWATPLCMLPTAVNSVAQAINVTATVEGDAIPAGFEDTAEDALNAAFALLDISDGTLLVSDSYIKAIIHGAFDDGVITRVVLTGWADVTLVAGRVATVGTVTITEA